MVILLLKSDPDPWWKIAQYPETSVEERFWIQLTELYDASHDDLV